MFKKSHIEGGKNSVPANDVLGSNIEVISGKTCIFSVGVIKVAWICMDMGNEV